MRNLSSRVAAAASVALLFVLTMLGCGGGGGGAGGGAVSLFMTDSMSSNQHVWVKLYQVVLLNGSNQTLAFDSAEGKTIDVRALRDGSGARFKFLNRKNIPAGTYTGIAFVLDKSLSVVPNGGGPAVAKTFISDLDTAGGKTLLSLTFGTPKALGAGDDDLVVDFDLANWNDVGNVVTPVIVESSQAGFDDIGRHEREDYTGTVSDLTGTAPAFAFTLTQHEGGTFQVTTDANTSIFNSNGSPSPALANGKRVEVRGTFNKTSNSLLATSIKIEDAQEQDRPEAKGAPSNPNASAGTFTITLGQAEHFVPTGSTVNIVTTAQTMFRSVHGQTIDAKTFYGALSTAAMVEVEGTYDSVTNTLTAVKARVEEQGGGDGGDQGVEARGTFGQPNLGTLTFNLTIDSWEGFSGTQGQTLTVTATSAEFKNALNGNVTASEFYTLAQQAGAKVKVEGALSGTTIDARECKIILTSN